MKFVSYSSPFAAVCLAAALAAAPAPAGAQEAAAATLPAEIPVGPAEDNPETSRGLTTILRLCTDAYIAADAFHSEGSYHAISKSEDDGTTHLQATVTMDFQRPDRMAIHSKSKSAELKSSFVADGKTVTQVFADEKGYIKMPQPELASFVDSHRAGEIYEEKSGAMAISVVGPMLMSEDPYAILHEDIRQYIYEGEEEAGGQPCHRVRFVQDDPYVVVILWIDKTTWLIRKASFITSYDEDFENVESYEEGVLASMLIMTWDKITTSAQSVDKAAFKVDIPKGFMEVEPPSRKDADKQAQSGSIWKSLVTIAAETSPEETTWSLASETSGTTLTLDLFAELPGPIEEFDEVMMPSSSLPQLAIALEDGTVSIHGADGSAGSSFTLGMPIKMLAYLDTKSSGPMFLAVNDEYNKLSAHDATGKALWEYQHPQATISTIATAPSSTSTEEAVYVTLSGKSGLRKIGADGKVQFANRRVGYTSGLKPAPEGIDRVLSRGVFKVNVLDKKLELLSTIDTEQDLPSMRWDTENPERPIVAVAVSTDSDILLQRRAEDGEIAWTTTISPKAENVESSALYWANMRVNGTVSRCLAVLLSDGQLVLAAPDGTILYRGKISANEALIKRNGGHVVQNMGVSDLDGDGVDEIYTRMDNYILRLKTD